MITLDEADKLLKDIYINMINDAINNSDDKSRDFQDEHVNLLLDEQNNDK